MAKKAKKNNKDLDQIFSKKDIQNLIDNLKNDDDVLVTKSIEELVKLNHIPALPYMELSPRFSDSRSYFGDISEALGKGAAALRKELDESDLKKDIKRLIKALESPYDSVVKRSAGALTEIGNLAVKDLVKCYKKVDNKVKFYVLSAVSLMEPKDSRHINLLLAGLKSSEIVLKITAATNLRYCKDKKIIKPLIDALEDTAPEFLIRVILSLWEIGDVSAIKPLSEISLRDYPKVKSGRSEIDVADYAKQAVAHIRIKNNL